MVTNNSSPSLGIFVTSPRGFASLRNIAVAGTSAEKREVVRVFRLVPPAGIEPAITA